MKYALLFVLTVLISISLFAQENSAQKFWNTLQKHCGKAFEGTLTETAGNEVFAGKKLVMHIRACNDSTMRIPFFVGDDKSRTWVLLLKDNQISLKHDHRHEDGTEDTITQYGGRATNSGLPTTQLFPADAYTAKLIPAASTNVWWITISETEFSYNLRRIGTDRLFTVKFDLTKAITLPSAPWGWRD